jgi:ACS family D-galactonate transporter-like MFS transporter
VRFIVFAFLIMGRSIIAPAERVTNLRWGIALILGFGVLVNYIDRGALSVAQAPLADELHVGPLEFGLLSSAFFWIYALAQVPIGIALDRFGVMIISRVGALLWTLASILTAIAPNFALLFAARSFLGIAEAPTFPANAKAVGYWFPRNERGLATSLFDSAAKLSNGIGVLFTAWLLTLFGWRGMFWSTAALSLVFAGLFYLFYRNPSRDKRLTHAEAKYIADGGAEVETPVGETPRGAGLGYLVMQPKVWGLTFGFAAYGYLFALLLTWLPGYLTTTFGVNIIKAGAFALLIWGVGTITDLVVGGWLVDYLIKRGMDANRVRKTLLIVGLVLGFAVIGAAYTKDINIAVMWITIAVAGISFHAPVGWSIPALIAPRNTAGQVGGIMNLFNNLAGAAAPIATGFIVAKTGSFSIAIITAAIILLVGIVSYSFVLGRIEKIPEPV